MQTAYLCINFALGETADHVWNEPSAAFVSPHAT